MNRLMSLAGPTQGQARREQNYCATAAETVAEHLDHRSNSRRCLDLNRLGNLCSQADLSSRTR
jgi:hypothetical protein